MIYSVRGPLISCDMTSAVVECGGVGMKCFVSMNTRKKLAPIGTEVMLFTHLNVREDAMDLFGFIDPDELEMFRLITSVSGVGPKVALSILSEFEPSQLSLYIASGDSKSITRASGVGAKLAQRIVLELKDKLGATSFADSQEVSAAVNVSSSYNASEAVQALVALGYSQSEASLAIGKLDATQSVEFLIKEGLKLLARF